MLNEIKNYALICVAFIIAYFAGKTKAKDESSKNTNANSVHDIVESKKNISDIAKLTDDEVSEQLSPFKHKS